MWQTALVGGGFVTCFLYVFWPFGMHTAAESEVFQLCLEFGLITAAVAFIWEGITRLFPVLFREERWTVWKEVAAMLLFVCLVGRRSFTVATAPAWSTCTGCIKSPVMRKVINSMWRAWRS